MKNKIKFIITVVFVCTILSKISAFATVSMKETPETLAVALVIDVSGSMAVTDPQNLRETAANFFIDLLDFDDYLSIITFNTEVEIVIPMQKILNSDNKATFKNLLSREILSVSGDTDYLIALKEAENQLSSVTEEGIRKVIIFLTDGEPDPNSKMRYDPEFMNPYMDSLWQAVSDLARNNYAVYPVGFSKHVDPTVLERISQSTQGDFRITNDSRELVVSFFDIYGELKNSRELMNKTFELDGNASLEFDADEYTLRTTIVFINNDGRPFEVTVNGPDGQLLDEAVIVNKSDKYSIVIVNHKEEKSPNKWQVNLKGNGNISAFGNKNLQPFDEEKKQSEAQVNIPVEQEKLDTKEEVSKAENLQRNSKDNKYFAIMLLEIILGLILFIIFIGLLLYMLFVYKNTFVRGKLLYWMETVKGLESRHELNFDKVKKNKIVISFNEENKNADYHISGSRYDYDIELTVILQTSKFKFIDGFKALFNMAGSPELLLRTTEPGIFIYEDGIYTSKRIYNNDRFITGGYVFVYCVNDKKNLLGRGRNLLEEREA